MVYILPSLYPALVGFGIVVVDRAENDSKKVPFLSLDYRLLTVLILDGLVKWDLDILCFHHLLHILSYMPKDLNFVNHTSYIGWKESRILKPVVVDPGLFLAEQSSPTSILSRKFVEYCILGTENLPRTLLMYLSNSLSSDSVYFPTVLCNSPQLNRTVVNHNLQYSAYETKHEPRLLHSDDFNDLINSGSAFASPFLPDDPILDRIDQELLNRGQGKPVAGGWCLGGESSDEACSVWGDADVLKPGPGAKRLEQRMVELLSNETFISHQLGTMVVVDLVVHLKGGEFGSDQSTVERVGLDQVVNTLPLETEVKGSILTPYKAGDPFLSLVKSEVASLPLVGVWLSTSQPLSYTVEDGIVTHNP
ncbi:beta-glucuronosyltransferase GlcAT14A [Tanacetum coccineum]